MRGSYCCVFIVHSFADLGAPKLRVRGVCDVIGVVPGIVQESYGLQHCSSNENRTEGLSGRKMVGYVVCRNLQSSRTANKRFCGSPPCLYSSQRFANVLCFVALELVQGV